MSRWICVEDIGSMETRTDQELIDSAPSIDICFCKDCISADEKPIADGRYWCNIHGNFMYYCSDGKRGIDGKDDYVKRKTENSSEKPNNCEHITEDGVTCAKYPACDDCPDNPLNKVKGSERLVKGSEKPNNSEIPTGSERSSE